jgi:hypothetical protein
MVSRNEKSFKKHLGQRKRMTNQGPDLPILKSSKYQLQKEPGSGKGMSRKDKSLERKMNRTINSEMNSQISGKNLSEFSIKFEGLSDSFSRNDNQDIDDGKSGGVESVNVKGKDLKDMGFMYKTDKFKRYRNASDVQRSKSATNQSQKIIQSDFGKVFDNSVIDKRKNLGKRKEKSTKKKIKNKRKASAGDQVENAKKQEKVDFDKKELEGILKKTKKKRKKKLNVKSRLKKSSNTNSDKKIKKLARLEKDENGHKKSFSVNTPSQFRKILKDIEKGSKHRAKQIRTEKNSLKSKASSMYTDSKETSLRTDSNSKKASRLKTQKSKFSNTVNSSESDPKSRISNKKTTHKSQNSKEESEGKESLEKRKKKLINPTILTTPLNPNDYEKEETTRRDENFESFAMIDGGLPDVKFDSFFGQELSNLKEVLRNTQEERGVRLDKGIDSLFAHVI